MLQEVVINDVGWSRVVKKVNSEEGRVVVVWWWRRSGWFRNNVGRRDGFVQGAGREVRAAGQAGGRAGAQDRGRDGK